MAMPKKAGRSGSPNPVREQELLHSLLPKRHRYKPRIVCIGAFGNPRLDPSAAALAARTPSKSVTVVDFQDKHLRVKFNRWLKRGALLGRMPPMEVIRRSAVLKIGKEMVDNANISPAGGLVGYRRGMKRLGIGKAIRLQPGFAWDTGLRKGNADLIVDRDTMQWVGEQGGGYVEKTIAHYYDLLKKGGSFVLLLGGRHTGAQEKIILNRMEKNGDIRVERTMIDDPWYRFGKNEILPAYAMGEALVATKLKGSKSL